MQKNDREITIAVYKSAVLFSSTIQKAQLGEYSFFLDSSMQNRSVPETPYRQEVLLKIDYRGMHIYQNYLLSFKKVINYLMERGHEVDDEVCT